MTVAIFLLAAASFVFPVGALTIFLVKAHKERTKVDGHVERARAAYTRLGVAIDAGDAEDMAAQRKIITDIRRPYGTSQGKLRDLDVIDLIGVQATARARVPDAWGEFIFFSVGLLCGAIAAVLPLFE